MEVKGSVIVKTPTVYGSIKTKDGRTSSKEESKGIRKELKP